MKSDMVQVTNTDDGIEAALSAAAKSAEYRGLERKSALHLRLLAEETLGMVRQITGETEAEFWIESEGTSFEIHLVAHPIVTGSMKRELIKASSSGKNEAARGFMGKIREVFEKFLLTEETGGKPDYTQGVMLMPDMAMNDPMTYMAAESMISWSMNRYKEALEKEKAESESAKEKWDELEKSIVANIADEIKIAVTDGKVEMIVYKKF